MLDCCWCCCSWRAHPCCSHLPFAASASLSNTCFFWANVATFVSLKQFLLRWCILCSSKRFINRYRRISAFLHEISSIEKQLRGLLILSFLSTRKIKRKSTHLFRCYSHSENDDATFIKWHLFRDFFFLSNFLINTRHSMLVSLFLAVGILVVCARFIRASIPSWWPLLNIPILYLESSLTVSPHACCDLRFIHHLNSC